MFRSIGTIFTSLSQFAIANINSNGDDKRFRWHEDTLGEICCFLTIRDLFWSFAMISKNYNQFLFNSKKRLSILVNCGLKHDFGSSLDVLNIKVNFNTSNKNISHQLLQIYTNWQYWFDSACMVGVYSVKEWKEKQKYVILQSDDGLNTCNNHYIDSIGNCIHWDMSFLLRLGNFNTLRYWIKRAIITSRSLCESDHNNRNRCMAITFNVEMMMNKQNTLLVPLRTIDREASTWQWYNYNYYYNPECKVYHELGLETVICQMIHPNGGSGIMDECVSKNGWNENEFSKLIEWYCKHYKDEMIYFDFWQVFNYRLYQQQHENDKYLRDLTYAKIMIDYYREYKMYPINDVYFFYQVKVCFFVFFYLCVGIDHDLDLSTCTYHVVFDYNSSILIAPEEQAKRLLHLKNCLIYGCNDNYHVCILNTIKSLIDYFLDIFDAIIYKETKDRYMMPNDDGYDDFVGYDSEDERMTPFEREWLLSQRELSSRASNSLITKVSETTKYKIKIKLKDKGKDIYSNKSTYEFMKFLVDRREKHGKKSCINYQESKFASLPYKGQGIIKRELDDLLHEIYSICGVEKQLMKRKCISLY